MIFSSVQSIRRTAGDQSDTICTRFCSDLSTVDNTLTPRSQLLLLLLRLRLRLGHGLCGRITHKSSISSLYLRHARIAILSYRLNSLSCIAHIKSKSKSNTYIYIYRRLKWSQNVGCKSPTESFICVRSQVVTNSCPYFAHVQSASACPRLRISVRIVFSLERVSAWDSAQSELTYYRALCLHLHSYSSHSLSRTCFVVVAHGAGIVLHCLRFIYVQQRRDFHINQISLLNNIIIISQLHAL